MFFVKLWSLGGEIYFIKKIYCLNKCKIIVLIYEDEKEIFNQNVKVLYFKLESIVDIL